MNAKLVDAALAELARSGLKRALRVIERVQGPFVQIEGRRLLCFCSNDYLGLGQHPDLRAALTVEDGEPAGSGASRLLSGTTRAHRSLEERMARLKGMPAALLFNNAYMANLGVMTTVAGPNSIVISDALNHASLIDGIRLSRAKVRIVRHGDLQAVEEALRDTRGHRVIVTETLFSMDGDRAPLEGLIGLARRYEADLVVDDTHAFGLFGERGRGLADDRFPVQVCNLSKAAGWIGGFALGETNFIELLVSRARSFIYTTSLPPAVCRAGIRALDLVEAADDRRSLLRSRSMHFREGLRRLGVPVEVEGPVFPIRLGPTSRALAAGAALWEEGFFLPAIRPPTVPEGTARLRVSISALHDPSHLDALLEALGRIL